MGIVTLLTDFGTDDAYVAEMKGVLLGRAPGATLVDVTHAIRPGDIRGGQFVLSRVWHRFPRGTVHLAVVDPGVGTARPALLASADGHHFVGPDNGLFTFLLPRARLVVLPVPADAAPTFHGRDVFAPAAAALAAGAAPSALGTAVHGAVELPLPAARTDGNAVVGEVLAVDRFGNLVTNVGSELLRPGAVVEVGGRAVGGVRTTFADVAAGEPVAYRGSGGTLEVAVRAGSAAASLGAGVGSTVRVAAR